MTARLRVYRADPMQWTEFERDTPPDEFKRAGIEYVGDAGAADIVLAQNGRPLLPFGRLAKRFAIWTIEPRYDLHLKPVVRIPGIRQPVHVMNVYTGVLTDNFGLFWHKDSLDPDSALRTFRDKPKRAAMLATFMKRRDWLRWWLRRRSKGVDRRSSLVRTAGGGLFRGDADLDLYQRRQALGKLLYDRGFCDIFGRDWPPSQVAVAGESRSGNWRATKRETLEKYAINIALENTIAPHYVTEKIWDAIRAACLPVYHGIGNRIYDDFPADSFIETGDKDLPSLAEEIMRLDDAEACDRYEICLAVYNRVVAGDRGSVSRADRRRRTAEFLLRIADQPLAS